MEKALIFEIKHFAVHDGDGIRTTVFFSGCPLSCLWCHNPEGLKKEKRLALYSHLCVSCGECAKVCPNDVHTFDRGEHSLKRENCSFCGKCVKICPNNALRVYGREVAVEDLLPELLKDRDFYEESGGGVTLSGGECLLQSRFCARLLSELKNEGINTAVDTCGFVGREAIQEVMPYTDVFLFDIKAANSDLHRRLTGAPNELILENLRFIDSSGAAVEVRIPFVPGLNSVEIPAIAEILSKLKHLVGARILGYHNFAASKYSALGISSELPDRLPGKEELSAAKDILTGKGIKVID